MFSLRKSKLDAQAELKTTKDALKFRAEHRVYWLFSPGRHRALGPFVGDYPKTRQYAGYTVVGFSPDVFGIIPDKETKTDGE